jgi:hypothetical protein
MNEAFIKVVQDKLGFDLREKTRPEFTGYLWEHEISPVDLFEDVIDQQAVKQYMEETGSGEMVAQLAICLRVLGDVCKPQEPYTSEQIEKIKALREKYRHILDLGDNDGCCPL